MEEKVIQTLFALIRSAIKGNPMTEEEKAQFSEEMVPELMKLAQKHDLAHLVGYGVYKNELLEKNSPYGCKRGSLCRCEYDLCPDGRCLP